MSLLVDEIREQYELATRSNLEKEKKALAYLLNKAAKGEYTSLTIEMRDEPRLISYLHDQGFTVEVKSQGDDRLTINISGWVDTKEMDYTPVDRVVYGQWKTILEDQ